MDVVQTNYYYEPMATYANITKQLSALREKHGFIADDPKIRSRATRLLNQLIKDPNKVNLDFYKEKVASLIYTLDKRSAEEEVKELYNDINKAKRWINQYKKLMEDIRVEAVTLAVKGGIEGLANKILERAKQLVPVDTGALKNSGKVIVGNGGLSAIIVFDINYATYVHEDLSKNHSNGQAKFLEVALDEYLPDGEAHWVETTGFSIVWAEISYKNDKYKVYYKHYGIE